jgi:hypothetical protein
MISIFIMLLYHHPQMRRIRNDQANEDGKIKRAVVHSIHAANNGPNSDWVMVL